MLLTQPALAGSFDVAIRRGVPSGGQFQDPAGRVSLIFVMRKPAASRPETVQRLKDAWLQYAKKVGVVFAGQSRASSLLQGTSFANQLATKSLHLLPAPPGARRCCVIVD